MPGDDQRLGWSAVAFWAMVVFLLICAVNALFGCVTINVTDSAPGLQVPQDEPPPNDAEKDHQSLQSLWL